MEGHHGQLLILLRRLLCHRGVCVSQRRRDLPFRVCMRVFIMAPICYHGSFIQQRWLVGKLSVELDSPFQSWLGRCDDLIIEILQGQVSQLGRLFPPWNRIHVRVDQSCKPLILSVHQRKLVRYLLLLSSLYWLNDFHHIVREDWCLRVLKGSIKGHV
jgi:hypothetical protein